MTKRAIKRSGTSLKVILLLILCLSIIMPFITTVDKQDMDPSIQQKGLKVLTVDTCSSRAKSIFKNLDLNVVLLFSHNTISSYSPMEIAETPLYKMPAMKPPIRPPAAA